MIHSCSRVGTAVEEGLKQWERSKTVGEGLNSGRGKGVKLDVLKLTEVQYEHVAVVE